ncbi:hypothetical protein ACFSCZ_12420 [Siminovitchia sediminis]|uniref:Uncharacterized protein n=1 Tax=Siminovitchia sediminis TaxID=1274353 RepID=A0ABW4KK17_9BACI
MILPSDFYDEKDIISITKELDSIEFDKLIKSYICEWLQTKKMQNIILERPSLLVRNKKKGNVKAQFINRFIRTIGKFIRRQDHFTWENYCKIIREFLKLTLGYRSPLRLMTRNFYLHVLSSKIITDTEVKNFIKQYGYLLLHTEYATKNAGSRKTTLFIEQNITTYFPLDSMVEQIIQMECDTGLGKIYHANFFIRTQNEFLYKIIVNFMEIHNRKKLNTFETRIFITLFEDSLKGLQINSFKDFNKETFKTQLLYYNAFLHEFYPKGRKNNFSYNLLVKFYRYIDDMYMEEFGHRLFNSFSFNRDIITHMYYQKSVEEGYEIVNLNSIGDYPNTDKWFIVADTKKQGTHIANAKNTLMNFELIRNLELREDLKGFIWKLEASYGRIYVYFSNIIDFLNEADSYFKKELEVSPMRTISGTTVPNQLLGSSEVKLFSNRFLTYYYDCLIDNEEWSANYINSRIKNIRFFLDQIKHKYGIPSIMIELFRKIDVDYKGGTPILAEDFIKISTEFRKRIHTEEDELLFIAFQLTAETKLRLGETLGLERDCICSIDKNGRFGTIRYLKKTLEREYIHEVLMIEHIRLIQRAINITQKIYEQTDSDLGKYIFIGAGSFYGNKVVKIRTRFRVMFSEVIDELLLTKKIKVRYTPINLRHTYIEKAWQNVEDGLISTLEIGVITGNSAGVAYKHYRNRNNTQRYVEALYGVSIFDDDLSKQVVDKETVEHLAPVQGGAGGCSSETCIKMEVDEDSFYKCLTCPKFVTTTERSSFFEKKMDEYKDKKEMATSNAEKQFYTGLMELYGGYLAEMYSQMEVEK